MKVIIVGGVAGGASTAARLRRLSESAEIILFERSPHVSYANCGLPYHIGNVIARREQLLLQTPEQLRANLNLDVRVDSEVVDVDADKKTVRVHDRAKDTFYEESWDKLVLCPGGTPFRPPTPGDDHPKIYSLQNVRDMDAIKAEVDGGARSALVIGGGFIGVEVAENLVERGLRVDLVELAGQILAPFDQEMARELESHMVRNSVRLHLRTRVTSFEDADGGVRCTLSNGVSLHMDFVISAMGVLPSTALAEKAGIALGSRGGIQVNEHMQTSHPDIYAAGDAVEVRDLLTGEPVLVPLAGPAQRQARVVADNICGRESTFGVVQGTSILKVFEMTAASTGANEKRLRAAKLPYQKIYIHPAGHASYYPDTAAMHMKLLFSVPEGKVLGAQIVGYDGVDKRIDVMAVAIRGGMTVYDLEELELAYAPPYGSAKDPVNMAGFAASNVLKNDASIKHAEDWSELGEAAYIVDVRDASEFKRWHIPKAVNIPLSEVRTRLSEFPQDKPILLYCRSGLRSYFALRILKQTGGYDAYSMSGGALTFAMLDDDIRTGRRLYPEVPHGETPFFETIKSSGKVIEIDATHLACPGPLNALKGKLAEAALGDDVTVHASDPMFLSFLPAWCNTLGHVIVDTMQADGHVMARVRKGVSIRSVA